MTDRPDRHRLKPTNFRPEADEIDPVKADLASKGRQLDGFLRACLRWYRDDPDAATTTLAAHWPAPRHRGRRPNA